jgi:hypothetical protein
VLHMNQKSPSPSKCRSSPDKRRSRKFGSPVRATIHPDEKRTSAHVSERTAFGPCGLLRMAGDPIPSFELILEITTLEGTARSAKIVASRRHWPAGR